MRHKLDKACLEFVLFSKALAAKYGLNVLYHTQVDRSGMVLKL